MTRSLARRITRNVHRKPRPTNGTQFRNRINQAAHKYQTSERKVHAALTSHYNENCRTEWYPDQVSPT